MLGKRLIIGIFSYKNKKKFRKNSKTCGLFHTHKHTDVKIVDVLFFPFLLAQVGYCQEANNKYFEIEMCFYFELSIRVLTIIG